MIFFTNEIMKDLYFSLFKIKYIVISIIKKVQSKVKTNKLYLHNNRIIIINLPLGNKIDKKQITSKHDEVL